MPNSNIDFLPNLIASLSSAEKRHFRIIINRINSKSEKRYMLLFDHIDKLGLLDEVELLRKHPELKKSQLSNLKSKLYKELLSSLRLQTKSNSEILALRESYDYARILYNRGLYRASLNLLEKVKRKTKHRCLYSLTLAILELEKHIESTYITGSMYPKAAALSTETRELINIISVKNKLSNLSLLLYGIYLQHGYVKNEEDKKRVELFYKEHLPAFTYKELDFYGKLYLAQSHVWMNNMNHNFAQCYRSAAKWVDLFKKEPEWIMWEFVLYIKGVHNELNALFMLGRYDRFKEVYDFMLETAAENQKLLNANERSQFAMVKYVHGINAIFLHADYEGGARYIDSISEEIEKNVSHWDLNRILVFYYKMACVYFGNEEYDKCIVLLNKVNARVYPEFRQDIQCFSKILSLFCHFELGNEVLVSYGVRSTFRFLSNMKHMEKGLKEILDFLRRTTHIRPEELKQEFILLKQKLEVISEEPLQRRPFLYLDIISWLQAKIEGVPIRQIIKRKIKSGGTKR